MATDEQITEVREAVKKYQRHCEDLGDETIYKLVRELNLSHGEVCKLWDRAVESERRY